VLGLRPHRHDPPVRHLNPATARSGGPTNAATTSMISARLCVSRTPGLCARIPTTASCSARRPRKPASKRRAESRPGRAARVEGRSKARERSAPSNSYHAIKYTTVGATDRIQG
jgi:hypothetical protein